MTTPPLLTRDETASILNIRPQTLAVWKTTGRYNLPVVKVGRAVRYRLADIERFIEERRTVGAESQDA